MQLDVQFYAQVVAKPEGIPDAWPALVFEVDDNAPATPNTTRMSLAEYDAYRAAHRAEYDAWNDPIQEAAAADAAALAVIDDVKDAYLTALVKRDLLGLDSAQADIDALAATVQGKVNSLPGALGRM